MNDGTVVASSGYHCFCLRNNPMQFSRSCEGQLRALSVYYGCPILYKDLLFHSAIHWYSWIKCKDALYRSSVLKADDSKQAGFYGTEMGVRFLNRHRKRDLIKLRNDWPQKAVPYMRYITQLKLDQNPNILQILQQTGDNRLINTDSPAFWWLDKPQDNQYGKLLMDLREIL